MNSIASDRNVVVILDHIAADLHFRVTLLDEQCHELRQSLHMCARNDVGDVAAKESDRETKEEPNESRHREVAAAEAALQEALQRARAIRNAQARKKCTGPSKADPSSSILKLAPDQTPKTPAIVTGDSSSSQDQPKPPRHQTQFESLPRQMLVKIADVADKTAIWSSQESPAKVFLRKLNQALSQRDAGASHVIQPPCIPYREQLFRLQFAYDRILHVLAKCSTYDTATDAPPSLAKVFPVWYRLHKIKKLLGEMNAELASVLRRTPPPPRLSQATVERSAAFLCAIRAKKTPPRDVDNRRLVGAMQQVDPKWSPDVAALYDKLQHAWDSGDYAACIADIARREIAHLVVPHVEHMLQVPTASKGEVVEALMMLRLLHSVACCEGLMMRSFVRGRQST